MTTQQTNQTAQAQSLQKEGLFKSEEFLQSQSWLKFQEGVGRKTFRLEAEGFLASVIEHSLPLVGKYLYVPKGPIFSCHSELTCLSDRQVSGSLPNNTGDLKLWIPDQVRNDINSLIELAKKENAGWVRIEPETEDILKMIKENIPGYNIAKAPHDMQPKEIFALDITKSQEQLLAEMKPKTRYNIKLAEKKGVAISHQPALSADKSSVIGQQEKYVEEFLRLTKEMAQRHGITAHPENYYRKMIEVLPSEMLKIYVAEFEGKIIAANLVLFFGKTVTYLHGASGNEHRNVMAPFLLQWQAILDAKELGFEKYDFGGISTNYEKNTNVRTTNKNSSWSGITDFKLGFSPNTVPVEFPGSYDIIVNPRKYGVYRGLQRAKGLLLKVHR